MSEFFFTQSSVKDLENEQTCPFRWKSQWIDKTIKSESNEHMEKGHYFEYLILGSGAITGAEIKEPKKLQNGNKSTEQLRLEEQAARAKEMLFKSESPDFLGFFEIKTQVELKVGDKKGTADIIAVDAQGNHWLIDLKLTADLKSDRTKYSYGNDWNELDLIQLSHYKDLYYQQYGISPKVGLLVFDYSTKKRAEFGEIVISDSKIEEKNIRFKAAEVVKALYDDRGWVKIPHPKECDSCPLQCLMRIDESKLIKKVIYY